MAGIGVGASDFAGAGDGERIGNDHFECAGVAIRRIVGERKPARGQQQVGGSLIDRGKTHAARGAVFLARDRAAVVEGERYFACRGWRRQERDAEEQRGLLLSRSKVRIWPSADFTELTRRSGCSSTSTVLDHFAGDEIHFGLRGDGLVFRMENDFDVVIGGAEGKRDAGPAPRAEDHQDQDEGSDRRNR